MRTCLDCPKILRGHFNRKRCAYHAAYRRRRPAGVLSPDQEQLVRELAGSMRIKDLAKRVGTSDSNLDRWARDHKVNINNLKYRDHEIMAVTSAYGIFGKKKTQEMFPNFRVRSIVERYKHFPPRQIKWKDSEIVEACRMAGLVSPAAQAKYFNRPRAHSGSIQSLWMKRFGFGQSSINGMVHFYAKELVGIKARYLRPVGRSRLGKQVNFRKVILWEDMEKCLKSDVPKFIREAVKTMADFQRWLHGGGDVKKKILKMMREREMAVE